MAPSKPKMLTPKELELAIMHAQKVHALEEAQRAKLRQATDLDTLRQALGEIGLPDGDIEKAIATLPTALAQEREKAKIHIWVGAATAVVVMAAGLVFALALQPKAPPLYFLSVSSQVGDAPSTRTWDEHVLLEGPVELHVAKQIEALGGRVVKELPAAKRQSIFMPQQEEPDPERLIRNLGADRMVVGQFKCTASDDDGLQSSLKFKVLNLQTKKFATWSIKGSARPPGWGDCPDLAKALTQSNDRQIKAMLEEVALVE
jgi:hypothetical protein